MPQPLPTIHTDRLILRAFTFDDVDDYQRVIHSDAAVMRYLPSGMPLPRERSVATLRYFIDHGQQWGFSFMAVTDKEIGGLMGHIGLHKLSDTVEIGYALGRSYWGGGYATEAARAVLRFGFEHVQLTEIIGLAFAANGASRRVMERLGMTYAGETDHYYETNLVLYRLPRAQFVAAPGHYLIV